MATREQFLQQVRNALVEGRKAGHASPLPQRGRVGYQGAGADPATKFIEMAAAMGAFPTRVSSMENARDAIVALVQTKQARRVVLSDDPILKELGLIRALREIDCDAFTLTPQTPRDAVFAADLGITGVSGLIAETGSLVMAAAPSQPRSASLLPPIHVAVARAEQILPDLFDVLAPYSDARVPPSCLTLITGPSKTGDIELKLVTGVHGPGEVHVIVIGAL